MKMIDQFEPKLLATFKKRYYDNYLKPMIKNKRIDILKSLNKLLSDRKLKDTNPELYNMIIRNKEKQISLLIEEIKTHDEYLYNNFDNHTLQYLIYVIGDIKLIPNMNDFTSELLQNMTMEEYSKHILSNNHHIEYWDKTNLKTLPAYKIVDLKKFSLKIDITKMPLRCLLHAFLAWISESKEKDFEYKSVSGYYQNYIKKVSKMTQEQDKLIRLLIEYYHV